MHCKVQEMKSNAVSFLMQKRDFLLFFFFRVACGERRDGTSIPAPALFAARVATKSRVIIHRCLAVLQQAWEKLRHAPWGIFCLWCRLLITSWKGGPYDRFYDRHVSKGLMEPTCRGDRNETGRCCFRLQNPESEHRGNAVVAGALCLKHITTKKIPSSSGALLSLPGATEWRSGFCTLKKRMAMIFRTGWRRNAQCP